MRVLEVESANLKDRNLAHSAKVRQRSFYLAARYITLRELEPQVEVPGAYRCAQWGDGEGGSVGLASCGKKEKKKVLISAQGVVQKALGP